MTGLRLFAAKFFGTPFAAVAGLLLEYLGYFAAFAFALLLLLTRAPLTWLERATGLGIRRRIIDAVALLSPG